jgi:hypothetical protein
MTDTNRTVGGDELTEVRALLSVLVMLQLEEREARCVEGPNTPKAEVVLADAGVDLVLSSKLLRKNPDAVRKTIQRSRIRQVKRSQGDD